MTLKVQKYNKLCMQAEWTVVVPRAGMSAESPTVTFEGSNWIFKLLTKWGESAGDEMWTMLFEKCARVNMPSKFLLTSHVRGKESDNPFMAQVEITHYETKIWSCTQRVFFSIYPQVQFTGNTLSFVFTFATFDYEVLNYQDCQKVDRDRTPAHVQTSPYLECLENLSLNLRRLMDDGSNPDVQLNCGDCTIPAHRLILSARSEVFRTMLQSDMLEGREGSVEIVDMESTLLEVFIEYLYTGILPELTVHMASALYEAGDKYHVEALRRRCGNFLAENLTQENACSILAMADSHSDNDLKERVASYVIDQQIPNNYEGWSKFCDDYPKVAIEVLNRAYRRLL